MTPEQLAIKNVGKQDPKRHLEEKVDVLMAANIVQCLGAMLDTVVFKWSSTFVCVSVCACECMRVCMFIYTWILLLTHCNINRFGKF